LESIENTLQKNATIFADSKSCLQAMDTLKIDHPLVDCILIKMDNLQNQFFSIIFCWVPGHVGLSGNERS